VRLEHPRDPLCLEGIDRVERFGRRGGCELDELGRLIEAGERVG
jgi:hypothetical protein